MKKGFTIIELLVTLAIAAGIIFLVIVLGVRIADLGTFVSYRLETRADIEYAFQVMATEIRSAGPSSLGAYPIVEASSTSIAFYSDVDKDGLFEFVRYFLAVSSPTTSTFTRGVIKPSGNPLAYATSSEVLKAVILNATPTSSVFTYFDENYAGSGQPLPQPVDPRAVRVVQAELRADINPGVAPEPVLFKAKVMLRNLRSN